MPPEGVHLQRQKRLKPHHDTEQKKKATFKASWKNKPSTWVHCTRDVSQASTWNCCFFVFDNCWEDSTVDNCWWFRNPFASNHQTWMYPQTRRKIMGITYQPQLVSLITGFLDHQQCHLRDFHGENLKPVGIPHPSLPLRLAGAIRTASARLTPTDAAITGRLPQRWGHRSLKKTRIKWGWLATGIQFLGEVSIQLMFWSLSGRNCRIASMNWVDCANN